MGSGRGRSFGVRSLAMRAPLTSFRIILFFLDASAELKKREVARRMAKTMAKILMVNCEEMVVDGENCEEDFTRESESFSFLSIVESRIFL